jgi:RNA polymerase sigma-70 factor (ECF subfamily)
MSICLNHMWEEFSGPLKSFIMKRVPSEADADDLLQEVFVKIHNNIEELKDDYKINAWVYRITRNTIADYYRRNYKSIELLEVPDDLIVEADQDESPNTEIAACLKVMIDSLPEKYKEAIWLTEYENLTQKELGERIGISLPGAKSRVQRGREKLKEMLLGCCHLEFDRMGNVIDYQHNSAECKYC